jgi:hypothetical protein
VVTQRTAVAVGAVLALAVDYRGFYAVWPLPLLGPLLVLAIAAALVVTMRRPASRRAALAAVVSVSALTIALALRAPVAPDAALFAVVYVALKGLLLALLVDGVRVRQDDDPLPRLAAPLLLVTAFVLAVGRVVFIVGNASSPRELGWSEAPFLTNMLKLDAGEVYYGPREWLASYSYSPLLELTHHALLAPLGRELSLHANRLLVITEQLVAAVLFFVAIAPHVRPGLTRIAPFRSAPWLVLLVFAASASSMLGGLLHPDHASLACLGLALLLVLREPLRPGIAWWVALVLVTPVATAFKLSGAGIGAGLAAIYLVEKRYRVVLALGVSGLLTVLTIPLFDRTLGQFSDYAIRLQGSHPMEWSRLLVAPTPQFGVAALLSLVIAFGMIKLVGPWPAPLRRALLLFGGGTLLLLPAYVKYAGRENNLTVPLVGAVFLVVLAAAHHAVALAPPARFHPLLGSVVALYALALVRFPDPPPSHGLPPRPVEQDLQATVDVLADDAAHHAGTLLLTETVPWISAGRRDVPRDRLFSAYELFYGNHPEAGLLIAHVKDGRYRTVVASSGRQLRGSNELAGQYAAMLARALTEDYVVVYPPGSPAAVDVGGTVIFRRVDRTDPPVAPASR